MGSTEPMAQFSSLSWMFRSSLQVSLQSAQLPPQYPSETPPMSKQPPSGAEPCSKPPCHNAYRCQCPRVISWTLRACQSNSLM